jgi:hypothetical protein
MPYDLHIQQYVGKFNFMTLLLSFIIQLFYYRYCALLGSKRVMGGFTGLMYGICFSFLGIFFILSSRRLDDERADAALLEKYKPVN